MNYKHLLSKNHTRLVLQIGLFVGGLLGALHASAQESASVLPKGIFRTRAVSVIGLGVDHSYNDDGSKIELLNKLNTTIPAATQAASNPDLQNLYDKLNSVEAGLGDKLFQTDLFAQGSLNFKRWTAAVEYGVTSKIAVGVIVPVVQLSINPTTSITVTTQSDAIIKKLEAMGPVMQPLADGVKQFEASKPTAQTYQQALFINKGYSLPSAVNVSGLGDIEVGGKWQFFKNSQIEASNQTGFRLPTATHIADPSNILDRSVGDGQTDFATQFVGTYEPINGLMFISSAKYTWQLPATRHMPVPSYNQVGLTDLTNDGNWDNVHRKLGDMIDTELAAEAFFMNRALYTYLSWDFSHKGEDAFSGSKNLNYAALAEETATMSHKAEIGLGYSTIPLFRAKKFSVPMEFKAAYNTTLSGKNVPDASYTRFDVYLYF